jgi:hypothetical protein
MVMERGVLIIYLSFGFGKMKSANENNCQFRFVNKFTKISLADITNPKPQVLATIMHVMAAQSCNAAVPHPPLRSLNQASLNQAVVHPPLAFNSSSLELQILRTQAELMAVNRRNCEMQDQLQHQQAEIEQLSLALHEAVQAEAVQPRLREVSLPRLSAPVEPAPITVDLAPAGTPIYRHTQTPETITIDATQASEAFADEPTPNLAVRVDLPTFPRPGTSRPWS